MIKRGANSVQQATKMTLYPEVFAPVEATLADGYVMPLMGERTPGDAAQMTQALSRLQRLWHGCGRRGPLPRVGIDEHHVVAVLPLASKPLLSPLCHWYDTANAQCGAPVDAVHGDATLENIMVYHGEAVWIDPSTRPMPHYVEFDCAKLLQTQFGYNGCRPEPGVAEFVAQQCRATRALVGYFLMTHLVRLFAVQPQARAWAVDIANTLEARLSEVYKCK